MSNRIILEHLDFLWSKDDEDRFLELWNQGKSLPTIANELKRDQREIVMLIVDLEDKVPIRHGAVYGSEG